MEIDPAEVTIGGEGPTDKKSMKLYAHPFSSYSQKVLIALYENATPFEYRSLEDPSANAELASLWPLKRFPVLVDQGHTILEASTIIEYLQVHYPGLVRLIPEGVGYRIVLDSIAAEPQGPRGAGSKGYGGPPIKAAKSKFIWYAIGITAIVTFFAVQEALESPDRP